MRQLLHNDLMWLVGLYEGEGHFSTRRNTPTMILRMTDAEVVCKAAELLEHDKRLGSGKLPSGKTVYTLNIGGSKAAEIMEQFEPYMCTRNALRIRFILAERRVWQKRKQSDTSLDMAVR